MVYARISFKLAILQDVEYQASEIKGVGRSATLVKDYFQLWFCLSKHKHRLDKILSKFRIKPSSADDDVLTTTFYNCLFTLQFGESINAGRCTLLRFFTRCIIWICSKDIISAYMHEQSIHLLHQNGKITRSISIEFPT